MLHRRREVEPGIFWSVHGQTWELRLFGVRGTCHGKHPASLQIFRRNDDIEKRGRAPCTGCSPSWQKAHQCCCILMVGFWRIGAGFMTSSPCKQKAIIVQHSHERLLKHICSVLYDCTTDFTWPKVGLWRQGWVSVLYITWSEWVELLAQEVFNA